MTYDELHNNPYPTHMLNLKRMDEYKKKYDQEIPHSLQTNPQHREEEPQKTKSQKTSMERYEQYTDLITRRSANMIKQQPS